MPIMAKEVTKMKTKSISLLFFVGAVLLSLVAAKVAISSEQELVKELALYKENYHKARKVTIGPPGVDELKSGKYPQKIVETIFDFKEGDIQVYWIDVPLHSAYHYVAADILTVRGTASKYEYVKYLIKAGGHYYGETDRVIPSFKAEGGRISYILLIQRKKGSGRIQGPSKSVETKVTFIYHPK
jgi:hypothetical protein